MVEDTPLFSWNNLPVHESIYDRDGNVLELGVNDPRCDELDVHRCHGPCGRLLLGDAFTPGYQMCRPCTAEYQQSWRKENIERERANGRRRYAKNPEGQRDRELRSAWGWSLEGFKAMKAAQGGVCAICGEPETATMTVDGKERKLDLAIDHDHRHDWAHPTKKGCPGCIRGLLCRDCNTVLGKWDENVSRFRGAADYLESFRVPPSP